MDAERQWEPGDMAAGKTGREGSAGRYLMVSVDSHQTLGRPPVFCQRRLRTVPNEGHCLSTK